jgi:hypothetical protein
MVSTMRLTGGSLPPPPGATEAQRTSELGTVPFQRATKVLMFRQSRLVGNERHHLGHMHTNVSHAYGSNGQPLDIVIIGHHQDCE